MVALSTVKEFLSQYATPGGAVDEATNLIRSIVKLPEIARLYQRSATYRQWTFQQSTSYTQYFTIELRDLGQDKGQLIVSVMGGWRHYVDGLQAATEGAVRVELEEYRTSKDALEAVCKKFVERFQKPESRGNVKVFFDESEFMWVWKRPSSDAIVYTFDRSKAYHKDTCMSVYLIRGNGIVPDEHRFLGRDERNLLSSGLTSEFTVVGSEYHFTASLTPIYRNEVPFDRVYQHVPATSLHLYEFVLVDGETRYINLKRAENSLLKVPIHNYSTRIESLIPASKLFLLGKTDLYARRDKDEVPFLGWELEACSNQSTVGREATAQAFKNQLPWLVMCKLDGSIAPEGFETVSVPATLDYWRESSLSSALDSMRVAPYNMRSWEHVKCGFHVHVSRSALTVLDLQKMERFIHNPDNNAFITKIAGRSAGTYQKYDANLFNNRKKWSEPARRIRVAVPSELVEEEIRYFLPTFDRVAQGATDYISYQPADATELRRAQSLGAFVANFVSYEYLDQIIHRDESVLERYPNYENYGVEHIMPDIGRVSPIYLPEITGSSDSVEHVKFMRFLFEEVICVGRPKFSSLVKKFFPDWNLVVEQETVTPTPNEPDAIPSWKAGVRKSSAPYKRRVSLQASQMIKGPVGKGVNSRYDALNTTNKNTVEFRMFKGTMNGSTIMRYLEFVDALVRFVATTSATDDGLNYKTFVKWLRQDAFNITRYEHLVSFITENGFLDRKDIRRKSLPVIVSEDKDVTGLTAVPAKGFAEVEQTKPIGTFIFRGALEETEPPAMDEDDADEQYEALGGEYEEYDVSDPSCDCDDCRIARGEELEDE